MLCLIASVAWGQTFCLEQHGDSLALLRLGEGSEADVWRLPYPTYRFAMADVDGDGQTDALVGVVKPTRFDPRPARRLFVFRQVQGRVRPLWLGSRLVGELYDFRAEPDGTVVSLEQASDSTWFVGSYRWDHFGFVRTATRIRGASRSDAEREFKH